MVASAVFILDLKGKVLISRDYRGDIPNHTIEAFPKLLTENEDEGTVTPILHYEEKKVSFIYARLTNLYVVAITKKNSNVMMIEKFLRVLCKIFSRYFMLVEEESIKDNFVIIYELFDEAMDFGYPQVTDAKILKQYVTQESHQLQVQARPPPAVTNAVSWRTSGIKYKKNEVFLDVVESVNLLVAANGNVVQSEIHGSLVMKAYLSGMPELRLGLNDKILLQRSGNVKNKSVEMDDVQFHQCVRLSRFENNRTISFIPPDGQFQLMSYRVSANLTPLIMIETKMERHSHSRIRIVVKAKSQFKSKSTANDVTIYVPVPPDADTPKFRSTVGVTQWSPEKNAAVWAIKAFPGCKEYLMRCDFKLPSVESDEVEKKRPIVVTFHIPYHTVSGIQVRYLKVHEKSGYKAIPWVRYITKNGNYQLRVQ